MNSINKKQILYGLIASTIGLMIYIIDRPPNHTYLIYSTGLGISLYNTIPIIFGPIGNNLPAFVHVYSFSLITAGLLSCQRKGCFIICFSWFVIDCAFELGQRFSMWSSSIIPDWFSGVPFLEASKAYFTLGTFDFYDLVAVAVGSIAAYLTMLWSLERREYHEGE